jgi:hypothetical protein
MACLDGGQATPHHAVGIAPHFGRPFASLPQRVLLRFIFAPTVAKSAAADFFHLTSSVATTLIKFSMHYKY